mmetsp:Transcript_47432/g.93309  ORF Transcript_47432/g.93309 Transcript_47432/m.93309 type:complete len:109 (+) Transcript_47432:32-358(+)
MCFNAGAVDGVFVVPSPKAKKLAILLYTVLFLMLANSTLIALIGGLLSVLVRMFHVCIGLRAIGNPDGYSLQQLFCFFILSAWFFLDGLTSAILWKHCPQTLCVLWCL